jgi:hydroxypyruvate isomerase
MERRHFLRQGALAGSALMTGIGADAMDLKSTHAKAEKAFKLPYAIHDGQFANSAGPDFIDQIKFAYDQGFRAIEDNGMMERPPAEQQKIGDALAKLGMRMGVFVITTDGWHWKLSLTTGKQEWKDKMMKDCRTAIEVAKRCNAKWATVVPGNQDRTLLPAYQTANVVDALRRGSEILEKGGLVMVLEPLSDNPDLFLRTSAQTYEVCKAVNSPSCKILYDIYHMQRNEGDIIKNIDRAWDEIGYIQIGDNPDRNEPTTGEINYKNIFKHLYEKGYTGILGMEHGTSGKGKEGDTALIRAYRESDSF